MLSGEKALSAQRINGDRPQSAHQTPRGTVQYGSCKNQRCDKSELPEFDAHIEKQQRQRHVILGQTGFGQSTCKKISVSGESPCTVITVLGQSPCKKTFSARAASDK